MRRAVFAGLGRMGRVLLEQASATSLFDVVALVDVDPEARLRASATVGSDVKVFSNLAEAVAEITADCCVIATPSNHHLADVTTAIEAGLDVFCEKPLTLDPDDSLRLGQLAEQRGLHLQVGFWRRYSTPFRLLREIAERDLGDIVAVRAVQWDADPPPPSFTDPTVSGGLIVDCGIHEFDMAAWLGCDPLDDPAVFCGPVIDEAIAAANDADNVTIVSHARNGATLTVDLSLNCRYADDVRVEILGTRGAAFLETVPAWRVTARFAGGETRVEQQRPGDPDAFEDGVRSELAAFARRPLDGDVPRAAASATALALCLNATRVLRTTLQAKS